MAGVRIVIHPGIEMGREIGNMTIIVMSSTYQKFPVGIVYEDQNSWSTGRQFKEDFSKSYSGEISFSHLHGVIL